MCLLIVSISSLHLLGREASLPGIYHHPGLCWWGKCLRSTEKLIKINLAFTFSTWCLRRHCREGRGNGWTSCPLFLIIISLCLRCLFCPAVGVVWGGAGATALVLPVGSPLQEGPCEPLYKKDAEPHFLSPFIAEASLKKEKDNKNTEDGVANLLPLCVPRSSILHILFLLI